MKQVPLGKGVYALVDDEDLWRVSQNQWHLQDGYARSKMDTRHIYLHRFILGVTNPRIQVDHQDRNKLNCQKYNLRVATNRQNSLNRPPMSGFKGVSLNKGSKRWRAMFSKTHIGTYDTAEEAALAYDRFVYVIDPEFAYLNFPEKINGVMETGMAKRIRTCPFGPISRIA